MALHDLLFIYDATADFAPLSRDDADVTIAHTGNWSDLVADLKSRADDGHVFKRCVFTTHGAPGSIFLGDGTAKEKPPKFKAGSVGASGFTKHADKGLCRLFPFPNARLFFNGCEVGAEPGGREFLYAAASTWLKLSGGSAFAFTNNGYNLFGSAHVLHSFGTLVTATVGPGGQTVQPTPVVWPDDPRGGRLVGGQKF